MASRNKQFLNITRGTYIAQSARVADGFISRLVGLLSSPPLQPGEGLLIVPCNSIHMFGMKYAIDAIFFDKQWLVVGIVEGIAPGKLSKVYRAHCCLELPVGAIRESGTEVGDKCQVTEATT